MSDDLTVRVLVEIRDELRATRDELHATRNDLRTEIAEVRNAVVALDENVTALGQNVTALDQNVTALGQNLTALGERVTEVDIRHYTATLELTASNRAVHDSLKDRFDLRDRVERCEHEIEELKKKVG